LVVTERIEDVKPLGFYIRRLCDGKETYRMQQRSSLPGTDELDKNSLCVGQPIWHLDIKASKSVLPCRRFCPL
uniref:BRICHOS domain-containing protein n=1 Tax=Fundulus heteroclitus TaxID=8078 RepID=A0A3Q2PLU7_FUNHE